MSQSTRVIGSLYSQKFNINVNELDMTMEFIYINPITKEEEVVSRITLPVEAAHQLPALLTKLLSEQAEKKKSTIKARA